MQMCTMKCVLIIVKILHVAAALHIFINVEENEDKDVKIYKFYNRIMPQLAPPTAAGSAEHFVSCGHKSCQILDCTSAS